MVNWVGNGRVKRLRVPTWSASRQEQFVLSTCLYWNTQGNITGLWVYVNLDSHTLHTTHSNTFANNRYYYEITSDDKGAPLRQSRNIWFAWRSGSLWAKLHGQTTPSFRPPCFREHLHLCIATSAVNRLRSRNNAVMQKTGKQKVKDWRHIKGNVHNNTSSALVPVSLGHTKKWKPCYATLRPGETHLASCPLLPLPGRSVGLS